MSDGDATRKARWARTRSARHEAGDESPAAPSLPVTGPPAAPRRGSPPPPLLFQIDTLDPWSGSHPGEEPHSAPRHEIDEAFERALGPSFDPTAVSLRGMRGRRRVQHAGAPPIPDNPLVESARPPAVEPDAAEAPVAEAPPAEAPVIEAPVVEAPVVEAPVVEAPVVEAPVVEAPVVEPPAVEAPPVVEVPIVDAPPVGEPQPPALPPTVIAPPVPGADEVSQAATTGVIEPIPAMYVPPAPPPPPIDAPPAAPVSEPFPQLEPPVYVPPSSGPSAYITPPEEDQLFDQTVYDEPARAEPDPAATFWGPPVPQADAPFAPPPVDEPSPHFFTPTTAPTPITSPEPVPPVSPVSLSKAAPQAPDSAHADPWMLALQPEAPPFHPDAVPGTPAGALAAPAAPAEPGWFDGRVDPFDFAGQFGTPAPEWAPPAGPAGLDVESEDGTGRHRVDGTTDEKRTGRRRRPKKPARKAPWWELPALVALAIVIAVVVKSFVVQPFYIPSPSMEKTLHGCTGCSGDRILVNKPIYDLRDPHPGDIVVFNAPPGWDQEQGTKPPSNPILRAGRGFLQLVGFVPPDGLVLVKRVIATGGQTVKGVSTDGGLHEQVMISDHGTAGPWRTLKEPYVYMSGPDRLANFGPVTVPKNRLWVMGDHRDDSADSRYHCGPAEGSDPSGSTCDPTSSTVPVDDVIGKAFLIAWPPSRWRTLGTPSTFAGSIVLPVFFLRRRRRRRHAR